MNRRGFFGAMLGAVAAGASAKVAKAEPKVEPGCANLNWFPHRSEQGISARPDIREMQRMMDHMRSEINRALMLAPAAPFVVSREDFENHYSMPVRRPLPYLPMPQENVSNNLAWQNNYDGSLSYAPTYQNHYAAPQQVGYQQACSNYAEPFRLPDGRPYGQFQAHDAFAYAQAQQGAQSTQANARTAQQTMGALAQDPSYQARKAEALAMLGQSVASKGVLMSGETAKTLHAYAEDVNTGLRMRYLKEYDITPDPNPNRSDMVPLSLDYRRVYPEGE